MISEEYIMKRVREYAKTPEGKAAIKEKWGVDYEPDGTRRAQKRMRDLGEKCKRILFKHISRLIKSITLDDIIVGEPTKDKNGYIISISFKASALHRDSLYEDGYPEGLDNIVLLFAHGFTARDYAYGLWLRPSWDGGRYVSARSVKSRAPDNFLNDAVEEFNKTAVGFAVARLEGEYKN